MKINNTSSTTIDINPHKEDYRSAEDFFDEDFVLRYNQDKEDLEEINKIKDKMIENDCIIHVCCYPDTQVGFFDFWHYDLDEAIKILNNKLQ